MQKTKLLLSAVTALGLMACEDGPYQTYSPAPAGAGDRWNDGKNPGASDPQRQGYNENFGGGSAQEICTGSEKAKRWAEMINQPLRPPRFIAGLDLAGGDNWEGLTYEEAQGGVKNAQSGSLAASGLCQGDTQGFDGVDSFYSSWGDAAEVVVSYSQTTHKIDFIQLNQGYKGAIEFESRPGSPFSQDGIHKFTVEVGKQIRRDGQPFVWNWQDIPTRNKQATELYDALMYTFGPELPSDTTDCKANGKCLLIPDTNGGGVFGARGVGFYIHIPSISRPQPIPSTPDYLYVFVVKLLPFSQGIMHVKLDAEGPTLEAYGLGDKKANCRVTLGATYGSFLDNCLLVLNDPAKNQLNMNKWLGGHTHDDENFIFSVVGVNFDFQKKNIDPKDIVHDEWVPEREDTMSEYVMDVRASGPLLNECEVFDRENSVCKKEDLHGTAAIYREYARRVQDGINAMIPAAKRHELGDPKCLLPEEQPRGFDANAWIPEDGCTGFEGMVTPAKPNTGKPNIDKLSVGRDIARSLGMSTVLRPGDPQVFFCADPGTFAHCGGPTDPVGQAGTLWDISWRRVLRILGKGELANLPSELRDRRWYFREWAKAYVKYLRAAHLNPTDLSKPEFDKYEADDDNMFFDAHGAGAERFEYIDRDYVTHERGPINVEYMALIQSGNQQYVNYRTRMNRPEKTLYRAMATDKEGPIGKEHNWFLSNVVGSVVLKNGFYGATETKDAYFCATHVDDDCMGVDPTNHAPMDAEGNIILHNGKPFLARYPGAFGETPFTIGTNHLKVLERFEGKQNAWTEVPNWSNPYDPSSAPANPPVLNVLNDYKPMQPQEGFPIPINGTRNKFVSAFSLDFVGESTTFNFDFWYDKSDPNEQRIQLLAVETSDFLGDVFMCKDPASGDFLSVKIYDSMGDVIDWLHAHPLSYENCGILIQYSPYNNYPDYIAALPAGILLKVNAGSGYGRIGHVEVFQPGL